jgi:hypothetical protein
VYFGTVEVAIRKMMQQIVEGKKAYLFFEQVGTLRAYAFQVLDGVR